MSGLIMDRFVDGRLVESRAKNDVMSLMNQLGWFQVRADHLARFRFLSGLSRSDRWRFQ